MFDNLTGRLSGVIKSLRGEARLSEANIQKSLREVRMALLEADVALPVIKTFIANVKEKAVGHDYIIKCQLDVHAKKCLHLLKHGKLQRILYR